MEPDSLTRIPRLYRYLAPVYAPIRPLWTGLLGQAAEKYLDQVVLPPAFHPAAVVLDLGCGPGSNMERLQKLQLPCARYVGFDLSPEMLAASKFPNALTVSYTRGNAYWLPFASNSFDTILSTWMFSHLCEPYQVVQEAWRLLRPGGWMIIACFTRPPGFLGRLLHLIEPVFLMQCITPEVVHRWSDLFDVKTFHGGFNTVAYLQKNGIDALR